MIQAASISIFQSWQRLLGTKWCPYCTKGIRESENLHKPKAKSLRSLNTSCVHMCRLSFGVHSCGEALLLKSIGGTLDPRQKFGNLSARDAIIMVFKSHKGLACQHGHYGTILFYTTAIACLMAAASRRGSDNIQRALTSSRYIAPTAQQNQLIIY